MKAMLLERTGPVTAGSSPLRLVARAVPTPGAGEVAIAVAACGVCHTELDEIEGRLEARLPVIPGHQAVGTVIAHGPHSPGVDAPAIGTRVGVAWIFDACGRCARCRAGQENLCAAFRGTGCDVDGGYAEVMTAPAAFVHPIPAAFSDVEAAPLLCAGAIGYRSLALSGLLDGDAAGKRLGLTGFGASGHLVLALVRHHLPDVEVAVFARDAAARAHATSMGAAWTGATKARAPWPLDAIIDTTPAWTPVVEALANLAPGGRLVVNAIRKEAGDQDALLQIDYPRHLWREKEIKSVANVTRRDVRAFLDLAAEVPIRPTVETFPLEDANRALVELATRRVVGAKVLTMGPATVG